MKPSLVSCKRQNIPRHKHNCAQSAYSKIEKASGYACFAQTLEHNLEVFTMETKKGDYFGLGYVWSLILAISPVTSWILGAITRFQEGRILAGLIRIVFGFNIVYILDLIFMIFSKRILRLGCVL